MTSTPRTARPDSRDAWASAVRRHVTPSGRRPTPGALRVAWALSERLRLTRRHPDFMRCWPGTADIARSADVNPRNVHRYLTELQRAGLLAVVSCRCGRPMHKGGGRGHTRLIEARVPVCPHGLTIDPDAPCRACLACATRTDA